MTQENDTKQEVKPADALGRLSERTRVSRFWAVIIAIVGIFLLAFLIGLLVRGVSGGLDNAPDIPKVEI